MEPPVKRGEQEERASWRILVGWRRNPTRGARGAMSPPDPGEGEGGAPKPQLTILRTSSTEAEKGTIPGRSPMATSHLIPAPGRPMEI
jgi:hypothetical protein